MQSSFRFQFSSRAPHGCVQLMGDVEKHSSCCARHKRSGCWVGFEVEQELNSSPALGWLFVFLLPSMSKPGHEKPGKAAAHRPDVVHKPSSRQLFIEL